MGQYRAIRKIKRVVVTFSDGTTEHQGTSSDFSFTGMFIRTRHPFAPNTRVKIVMETDEKRKVTVTGVVARALKTRSTDFKNGMGVKISPITEEYKDFLKDLLVKEETKD